MKIAHLASEVYPFSKTGGLADVLSSLPKAQAAHGDEVCVFSPMYPGIAERFRLEDTGLATWVNTNRGVYDYRLFIKKTHGVKWCFLANMFQFDRAGLYSADGRDFDDNYLRFGCFCKAALDFMEAMQFDCEVVHAHDWQTAFVFPYLNMQNRGYAKIFTIHNLAFQGVFDSSAINELKIDQQLNHLECLEYWGKANFMKGAIELCDAFTTVSPGYAEEILADDGHLALGLQDFIRARAFKFRGILNGIDYADWNPATDACLDDNYALNDMDGRFQCKLDLCRDFNLDPAKPLFTVISRFTEQKGLLLLAEALEELKYRDISLVLLGDGERRICDALLAKAMQMPGMRVAIGYDNSLSRKLYAAADFFLMPSLFEPCGLSQMIAMHYGAVPVVRYTGGLKNTVRDVCYGGCGIVFADYTRAELINAVDRAIGLYHSPHMLEIRERAMYQDFAWHKSCLEYECLYKQFV